MLLSELIENIKMEVGQFEIDFDELTNDQYSKILLNQVSPIVNKNIPYTMFRRIEISASPYTFTSDIPEWVAEVNPIDMLNIGNLTRRLYEEGSGVNIYGRSEDTTIPSFLWEYDKVNGKLYLDHTGIFNIKSVHKMALQDQSPDDYEILYLDENAVPHMLNLMSGYVLKAMGRNRRVATLQELPFTLDGDQLVSEGIEQIREAKEEIGKYAKWELGAG